MKKPLLLMSLFLLGTLFMKPAAAQDAGDTTALLLRPHLVKINLTALPLRTFSFQYEHVMGPRITVGGGLRIMPKGGLPLLNRSEEHTSELQSLMRISYAVFCLKKKRSK